MRKSFGQHIQQSHRDRHIQLAVVGAAIVGGLHFVYGLLGTVAGESGAWAGILEGVLYFALAFAVYRRVFAAAVVLILT